MTANKQCPNNPQCPYIESERIKQQKEEVLDALDAAATRILLLWPWYLAKWVVRRVRGNQ